MASGYSGSSAPRTSGGISGKGGSNVNPFYKEMLKRLGLPESTEQIARNDIKKILQSNTPTMAELEKRIRSNPNKKTR